MKTKIKNIQERGITLIALIVTIVVLLILTGITLNMLFGNNGVIKMAKKSIEDYKNSKKEEDRELLSVFDKEFASYNGMLQVVDGELLNQYNEKIQLRGLVGTALSKYSKHYKDSQGFSYYLNKESVKVIKGWGTNVIRIGLEVEDVKDEKLMQDYLDTVDLLINNDMYVVVVLWNNHQINNNIDVAREYFAKISEKYGDTPNIIYEIANEPDNNVLWEQVKEYSNSIIPTIRNFSKDNIIIIPNTGRYIQPEQIQLSELISQNNIMTSYHLYVGTNFSKESIDYIKETKELKIPVFVTEWGTTLANGNDGFYEDYSNAFVELMSRYNLSWCNFHIGDLNFRVNSEYSGIVKNNMWKNSLTDDILTESGKYIKSILQGNCNSYNSGKYSIMMARDDSTAFWQDEYKNKIVSIEFKQSDIIPEKTEKSWDISLTGNGAVNAYIEPVENDYNLYIVSKNSINLPILCFKLFSGFQSLKTVKFNNVSTNTSNDFGSMFQFCYNLESIKGLENFDTKNIRVAYSMFAECRKLTELNLSNWNTKNLTSILNMFANCTNLSKIEGIGDWNTENLTKIDGAFAGTFALQNLDISNWKTDKITNINETFANSYIENLNISNWNLSNCTKLTGIFKSTITLKNIYLNNVEINVDNITDYNNLFYKMKDGVNIYVKDIKIAQFIYQRLEESSVTGNIFYKSEENWQEYNP